MADDGASPDAGEEVPALPTVCATVNVSSANLVIEAEGGAAPVSTFARVTMQGPRAKDWWWAGGEPDEADPDAPAGTILSQADSGPVPGYSYTQATKPITLSDDDVGDLANSLLVVTVVIGDTPTATGGQVLGTATVALDDLLFDHVRRPVGVLGARGVVCEGLPVHWIRARGSAQIEGEYDLNDIPEDLQSFVGSSINVSVTVPDALTDYTVGARLLTVASITTQCLPRQWLLGNSALEADDANGMEDTSDILALVADPAVNSARYELSIETPPGDGPRTRPLVALAAATAFATTAAGGEGSGDGEEAKGSDESKAGAEESTMDEEAKAAVVHKAVAVKGGGKVSYVAVPRSASRGSVRSVRSSSKEDEGDCKSYMWQLRWTDVHLFLSKSAISQLKEGISHGEGLRMTIRRIKCAPLGDDEEDCGLDGVKPVMEDFLGRGEFVVPVDELMVPGALFVDCETEVAPLAVTEEERKAAAEAAAKAAAEAEAAAAKGKKGKGKGKAKKGKGKAKKGKEPPPEEEDTDADKPPTLTESHTRVSFTVAVNEPLVLRPPTPPPPELKPSDLIPQRPKPPAGPPGIAASADFRQEVTEMAHQVAQEFVVVCQQLAEEEGSIVHTTPEMRRRALLRHLNDGGHYRAMKEKLKRHVVRIVRERFGKKRPDADNSARDVFLSELYTYLMGQVHRAINRAFTKANDGVAEAGHGADAAIPVSPTKTLTRLLNSTGKREELAASAGATYPTVVRGEESPDDRLRRMALEAEFLGQLSRAAKHHQDRVAKAEVDAAAGKTGGYNLATWFDYAMFCLRTGDVPKAGECLRECVAMDDSHVPSLLAFASVLTVQGQFDRAAVMAKGAIRLVDPPLPAEDEEGKDNVTAPPPEPQSNTQVSSNDLAVANIVLSVALERHEESKKAGVAVNDAIVSVQREQPGADAATAYLEASRYLLTLHLTALAEDTLRLAASVMLDSRPSSEQRIELLVLEARAFEQHGDRTRQAERLDAVEDLDSGCTEAWAMRGDALLAAGRVAEARSAYELAVGDWSSSGGAATDPAILMKLGRIYVDLHVSGAPGPTDQVSLGDSGKEVFLRAARASHWASAWCGAGEAALRIGDADEAEAALCEANTRDNYNAEVWGWLCLLCIMAQPVRETEAAQALNQALKLGLASGGLLEEIGEKYVALGRNKLAEGVLRRAVSSSAGAHAQRLLGDALAAQGDAEEALKVYSAVLSRDDVSGEDRKAASAGATQMQQQAGRA